MGAAEAISQRDVQSRQFVVSMRGYHRSEVDHYLDELAAELDRLHERLAKHDADEGATIRMIKTAAKTADELVAEAKAEAQQLRTEAFKEATWMRSEATVDTERVRAKTARWAEAREVASFADAARRHECALAEAAAIVEQAELSAIAIARLAVVEAEAARLQAWQDADEAFERIEYAEKVLATHADRLRSGAAAMTEFSDGLEHGLAQSGGDIIDLANVLENAHDNDPPLSPLQLRQEGR